MLTPTLFRAWLEKQQQPLRIVDYYKIYLGQFLPSVAARSARMLMDLATPPLQPTLSMEIDGAPVPFPNWAYWHFLFMAAREPKADLDPAIALALLDQALHPGSEPR